MKKKLLVLSLCLIFTIVSFSACSNSNQEDNQVDNNSSKSTNSKNNSSQDKSNDDKSNSSISLTEAGTFPIVEDKITFKFFVGMQSNVEDYKENTFTKHLEEITNVHIEWDQVPFAQAAETQNLIIASGEYPDAFLTPTFTREQLYNYGALGVFTPLNELIDKHSVYYKRELEKDPEIVNGLTTPDGNMYAITNGIWAYHMNAAQKMWLNKDFLSNLNIAAPKTTKEFKEYLIAVRDNDANGNGDKNDEIPLLGSKEWLYDFSAFLSGSFIPYDGKTKYINVIDGKVDFIADNEEWKNLLIYLKDLYDESLFPIESLTQDHSTKKKTFSSSDSAIVGATQSNAMAGITPKILDYVAIEPLEGENGLKQAISTLPSQRLTFIISSSCENPEVLVRWADWFFVDYENRMTAHWGPEGIGWVDADENGIGYTGNKAKWKALANFEDPTTDGWRNSTLGLNSEIDFRQAQQKSTNQEEVAKTSEYILYNATKNLYIPYLSNEALPELFYNEEDSKLIAEVESTTYDYVKQSVIRFILGDLDLANDWDQYVKEFTNIGTYEMEKAVQRTYDSSAYAK